MPPGGGVWLCSASGPDRWSLAGGSPAATTSMAAGAEPDSAGASGGLTASMIGGRSGAGPGGGPPVAAGSPPASSVTCLGPPSAFAMAPSSSGSRLCTMAIQLPDTRTTARRSSRRCRWACWESSIRVEGNSRPARICCQSSPRFAWAGGVAAIGDGGVSPSLGSRSDAALVAPGFALEAAGVAEAVGATDGSPGVGGGWIGPGPGSPSRLGADAMVLA